MTHPPEILVRQALAPLSAKSGRAGESPMTSPLADAVEQHVRCFLATHPDHTKIDNLLDLVQGEVERTLIKIALEIHHGNQVKAASLLGVNRNTLRKKMQMFEITSPRLPKSSP